MTEVEPNTHQLMEYNYKERPPAPSWLKWLHQQSLIFQEAAHNFFCTLDIGFLPQGFWNHTKHGATSEFKISSIYGI